MFSVSRRKVGEATVSCQLTGAAVVTEVSYLVNASLSKVLQLRRISPAVSLLSSRSTLGSPIGVPRTHLSR